MSSFDDEGPDYSENDFQPPEPKEKPVLDVKISNYDLGRMVDIAVYAAIERHVKKAVDKWVEQKVAKAVDAMVKEIGRETIKAAVEKALTEGWGKVNEWGEQRGEKVTLSTVVRDALLSLSKAGDRDYHSNRNKPSTIEAIVIAMAEDGVKTGLQPILEEAKKNLRSSLDVQLGKGLRLTLADVLKG